jgi:light-regulated signal transduction histidine kinase (bacteriophytochrome)
MPNDMRQAPTGIPSEHIFGLAGAETSGAGNAPPPTLVPVDTPASCQATPGWCRECLAAMAHRLAQPATALRGGIELALLGKRSVAEYRAMLEQSLELADSMAQLIVSLRDLGESSAPTGSPQDVTLEQMVREVEGELQALAEPRAIRFQITTEGATKVRLNPDRLRETFQNLFAWIIQNSAGGDVLEVEIFTSEGEACVALVPSRMDLQYMQIRMFEDIPNPGLLFSHATKIGVLGWAIIQRLVDSLGGRIEILAEGPSAGCIRLRFPLGPTT